MRAESTHRLTREAREDYGEELRKAICYVNGGGAIATASGGTLLVKKATWEVKCQMSLDDSAWVKDRRVKQELEYITKTAFGVYQPFHPRISHLEMIELLYILLACTFLSFSMAFLSSSPLPTYTKMQSESLQPYHDAGL